LKIPKKSGEMEKLKKVKNWENYRNPEKSRMIFFEKSDGGKI
jgi:hypothetical protein